MVGDVIYYARGGSGDDQNSRGVKGTEEEGLYSKNASA